MCPEPGEALPLVKKLFSMTRNLQLHLNPVNLSEDKLYNLYTAVTGVIVLFQKIGGRITFRAGAFEPK